MINNALQGKTAAGYMVMVRMSVIGCYVDDHAKAIDMVQEQGDVWARRYNVGGHNEKQNIQIIQHYPGYSSGDAAGWMIQEKNW